jgi:uncharacterized protein involved in exopolysaccharide biosynthesis
VTSNPEFRVAEDANMTGGQIVSLLVRRWRAIAICSFIFGAIAAIIGFTMTPVFRSTISLIPSETNDRSGLTSGSAGQLGGLAALAGLGGLGGNLQSATNEALAVLQSRQFVQQFIELDKVMPKLYPKQWDPATKDWKLGLSKVPTMGKAYQVFTHEIMDVYQDKKTNTVTLSISWRDRNEAAEWANQLTDTLNARMREQAITEADQTIKYLEQELPVADTVELKHAISTMLESQLKIKAVASVRKQYAFRVIDPAVASDPDVRLRPHKAIYILIGLAMGVLTGIAIIFLTDERRKIPDSRLN